MQERDQATDIGISLHYPGEDAAYIRLVIGDSQDTIFRLSLPQARMLATALIQHVHRADVSNSMKKAKQNTTQSSLDRSSASMHAPISRQA